MGGGGGAREPRGATGMGFGGWLIDSPLCKAVLEGCKITFTALYITRNTLSSFLDFLVFFDFELAHFSVVFASQWILWALTAGPNGAQVVALLNSFILVHFPQHSEQKNTSSQRML